MYTVISNNLIRDCESIELAIQVAANTVYASNNTKKLAKKELEEKKNTQWSYGFSTIQIVLKEI